MEGEKKVSKDPRLAEYERLKAMRADDFKDKKWEKAAKRFNEAAHDLQV